MTTPNQIPDGFKADAKGRLVPIAIIKPIDLLRDQLVTDLAISAKDISGMLQTFKKLAFSDIAAFVQTSAEQYGVRIGGDKGNVSLMTLDGRFKIVRQVQDTLRFGEELQAAKALIDECFTEWSEQIPDELKVIVMDAFRVNKEGAVQTDQVLGLRRHNIKHPKWLRAMDAISDSIQVVGSRTYVRVYERIGETDAYRAITLDLASA